MNLNAIEIESVPLKTILSPNVVTVEPESRVSDALKVMKSRTISSVVVVDEVNKPVGIFTEQDAIRLLAESKSLSLLIMGDVMSKPVLCAKESMGYGIAYQLMSDHQVRHLVVVDDNGVMVGLVSEGDFLHHMGMEYLVELKSVQTAMTQNVTTVDKNQPLTAALQIMSRQKISCVVATEADKPIGILTERDMVRIASDLDDISGLKVSDEMSSPLQSVFATTPLQHASYLMESKNIRRLTVVNSNGELQGVLTRHDIAKSLQGSYIEYLQETLNRKNKKLEDTEAELRAVEQKNFYQNLVEQVSDAIYIIDADDARILDVNQQASLSLQYERDDLLNMRITEISTLYTSLEEWLNKWIPEIRGKGEKWINSRHKRSDGALVPVEVKARLVKYRHKEYVVAIARDISERLESTRLLKESKKRFQSLFDNAPMAYQSLDMEGNIQAVNKAWLALAGVESEEVLGRNIADFLSHKSVETLGIEFPQFVKNKVVSGPIFEFVRPDGEIRIVSVSGQISQDEISGELRTHCLLNDVTEKEKNQQAIRESEERFRKIFEQSPYAMAYVEFSGDLIGINQEFIDQFGYKPEEISSFDAWVNRVHPNPVYREKARTNWLASVDEARAKNERIRPQEYVINCKNGQRKTVRASGIVTEQGFLAILQDITEQKRASAALKDSAETYFGVITTARDGFWIVDRKGKFRDVNEAYLKMSGYSREELMEMSISDVEAVETPEITRRRIQTIEEEGGQTFLSKHKRKNGEIYDVEVNATYWPGGDGRFFAFIRDVTQRLKRDEEIRQAATVFASTTEGVMITDKRGIIQRVNNAFCTLTGYSESEVVGHQPSILQSGRHDRLFYEQMWKSLTEKGSWQGEVWNRRKDGTTYPELLSVNAVYDEGRNVSHYVGVFADITHLKESEQELAYLAHHDMLTGLPNRLMIQSQLEQSLGVAQREDKKLALLLLDLDRFKDVNDSFGHASGDELLQQIADALRERLRQADLISRMGGDEFAILLDDIKHVEDAGVVADDIIKHLSRRWQLSNGREVAVGVSVGISLFPAHSADASSLLQHADAALYRAKSEGRGRFHYFTEELTIDARHRLELEARLMNAVSDNQLEVYFQPQLDIQSGTIIGAEALVRWNDPEKGLVMPGQFIALAEQTGIITDIGLFVLRQSCIQLKKWLDQGYSPITLAVNLSPVQLRHGDVYRLIEDVLADTGLSPQFLELEITESALMDREQESIELLQKLRSLGVRIAIDDFGTGYSSLAYLKKFPLDVLKIDKSFVDDIPSDKDDMVIASTIVAMGHNLGIRVLAEGVETEEQLEFLRSKDCHCYQGYLSSPPVPAADFELMLTKNLQ